MECLWVDKYRPETLQDLSYHPQITGIFRDLAHSSDLQHIIVHGPEGAGKKTRVYAFLHEKFGSTSTKVRVQDKVLKPENSSVTIEYKLVSSNAHVEITPSDNDFHDRFIVQHVVKDIASSQSVDRNDFKVLIINEADRLTQEAQAALRRTMEKYIGACRLIMICNHVHKLMAPIRSRCLKIRIPAPTTQDISKTLAYIAEKQKSTTFNPTVNAIESIAHNSDRNIRRAIITLQLSRHVRTPQQICAPHEKQFKQICAMILQEQSALQLRKIRDRFYELLVNCVQGGTILRGLLEGMMSWSLAENYLHEIIHSAAEHERSLNKGSKEIYHLESFAAHAMKEVATSKHSTMETS